MKIDPSTYHQLPVTKWTERKSFEKTNETFYLGINSNGHDIIEVSEYKVIESKTPIQIEKNDSGQELGLRPRGLTHKEKMIRKWVTNIYQYYAYISFTNNRSRIDIHI